MSHYLSRYVIGSVLTCGDTLLTEVNNLLIRWIKIFAVNPTLNTVSMSTKWIRESTEEAMPFKYKKFISKNIKITSLLLNTSITYPEEQMGS